MKASIAKTVVGVSLILGLGLSNVGCFLATHDPAALNRPSVTTTTRAEVDGGRNPSTRTSNAVENNDLSQDAR